MNQAFHPVAQLHTRPATLADLTEDGWDRLKGRNQTCYLRCCQCKDVVALEHGTVERDLLFCDKCRPVREQA